MAPDPSTGRPDARARAAAFAFVASAYALGEVVLLTTGWPVWGGFGLGVGLRWTPFFGPVLG